MSLSEDHRANGDTLLATYLVTGSVEDINSAVSRYRVALALDEESPEDKIRAQIALAKALCTEFDDGLADEEVFKESVALAEGALRDVEARSKLHVEALMALAEVLVGIRRFIAADDQGSRHAIDVCRQLVDLSTDLQSPLLIKAMCLLTLALARRMQSFGDSEALLAANDVVDRVLQLGDGSWKFLPEEAFPIAFARCWSFQLTEQWEDVCQATDVLQELISSLPPCHVSLSSCYHLLAVSFGMRHRYRGGEDDLDRCIDASFHGSQRVPPHNPRWHALHGNYATGLRDRFRLRSNLADLDEAIAISRILVENINRLPTTKRPMGADVWVGNLGQFLKESYEQYGRLELLDEAITLHLQNVEAAPEIRRTWALQQLAASYMFRFDAHGRVTDLENGVSFARQSVSSATLDRDASMSGLLLADTLLALYERRGDARDLEEAISLLPPIASFRFPDIGGEGSSLLGHALLRRFMTNGKIPEDLEGAIKYQRAALELIPEAHVAKSSAYFRLGEAEYQMTLKRHDVLSGHASVAAFNSALSALPGLHPSRSAYLRSRAHSELLLAEMAGQVFFDAGLQTLREAANHQESWASDRFAASTDWANVAHHTRRLDEAIEGYRTAISLLPGLAWVGLEDALRMQRLSRVGSDLAQDAMACAISLGDYQLAVEFSEAARSVLWSSAQELRADLSRLRENAPELATELAESSAALEFRRSSANKENSEDTEAMVEAERIRLHRLASRRTELLELIRARPGFERFLVPPTYDELSNAAANGPIVLINSSKYRCDALVLRPGRPIALVPLAALRHEQVLHDVWNLQTRLRLARDASGAQILERTLLDLLRRLWVSVGEPVCDLLFERRDPTQVHRLWWCPIGPMSFLPLHACGPHDDLHADLFDLVISSYTPTLSALLRAKTGSVPTLSDRTLSQRMLVICQPNVPGRQALPCALDELAAVQSILGSSVTALVSSQGTVRRVEELLPTHNWLHVSTHGTQKFDEPLQSSLALHDGVLTLATATQLNLPNAEFAFLSACHSAKGTYWVPNESMHLAGGLMFAGYKSVVATTWGIADRDAPKVVEVFYKHLMRKHGELRGIDTAEALHAAIRSLRNMGLPAWRWVPFIHLGA